VVALFIFLRLSNIMNGAPILGWATIKDCPYEINKKGNHKGLPLPFHTRFVGAIPCGCPFYFKTFKYHE